MAIHAWRNSCKYSAGSAYDVIVDVRRESPKPSSAAGTPSRCAPDEHTQVFIPAGCLHGFLALEDDQLLSYKQSAEYDPTEEFGIAGGDFDPVSIAWPLHGTAPPDS